MTSKLRIWILAMAAVLASQGAPAAEATEPSRPLTLKRAIVSLREGEVWGKMGSALACDLLPKDLTWRSGPSPLDTERFASIFNEEAGLAKLTGGDDANLFDEASASGGLQIGARIKEMHARICVLAVDENPAARKFRGSVDMAIEWQIYDPLSREVISRLETTARGEEKNLSRDGLEAVLVDGFRQNARALMNQEAFQSLAHGKAGTGAAGQQTGGFPALTLTGAGSTGGARLTDAIGSVVLVQTDDGHGSGFLVSSEGHVLTNAHVVGNARIVRIRWSDGFTADGEVVRVDKRRDVALIRTAPHSRPALVLRPSLAQTGEVAYAIGSPLDPKFQGTLTRGIVSAVRIYDGLNFVQSDVTVNPGNSGGPLLDESGRVIAITDLGIQPQGIPTGINLFIPIGDAMDFLNLKLAP